MNVLDTAGIREAAAMLAKLVEYESARRGMFRQRWNHAYAEGHETHVPHAPRGAPSND